MILEKPRHHGKHERQALPWAVRLVVSMVSTVVDNACRPNGTVNRRLIHFLDYQTPPISTTSVSSTDISIDATRNLWIRLYSPSNNQLLPVLIFFHGGGFSFLSPASLAFDMVCRNFATNLPAIGISVNYRLAPEHRYPSQCHDGFDALNFIDENWATVLPKNADSARCFFAGDSAGANLAHHEAVQACRTKLHTMKMIGLISIQPFFGGEERSQSEMQLVGSGLLVSVPLTDWCWNAYLPLGSNRDHEAANVSGPNADDISGLDFPATMVVVGGFDPLKDWQRRYYEWLLKSGKEARLIEYHNMIHAFYTFPLLPDFPLGCANQGVHCQVFIQSSKPQI
ncbi:probable carboxylesterase 18 [Gossypium raimondii]|uniref:Alpha/beta hydrolase fold-3 domain-containing protein n=1 Tax=Gossypium raimondii TaxID=29730 RepID=A0A0D2TI19_GOSRA|nr:probable carboxylesterase 18 [Gossypium raimondii]KJB75363.1 hypothetical protein B456_012G038300 [Gossypium raimondii]MBA0600892.1 hypothetical protein [Gossypium raimondii]